MRILLVLTLACGSMLPILASAQQPTVQPATRTRSWDAVRTLSPGTSLDIKLHKGSQNCSFRSADDDQLTCQSAASVILQRADIITVKVHHRGRSTLSGLAIGAGAGAIVGAASAPSCNNFCIVGGKGFGAAVLGIGGAGVGAIAGYFSDFTRSTVYKAP